MSHRRRVSLSKTEYSKLSIYLKNIDKMYRSKINLKLISKFRI